MSATTYRDGTALWRALTARVRIAAAASSRPGNELLRRFVYDRFLARVFADLHQDSAPGSGTELGTALATPDDSGWVLKGGTAVLARVHDARHSKDVDLLHRLGDIDDALAALRAAASRDLGDHFRFVLGSVRPVGGRQQPGLAGYRVQVEAYCGVRRCETFSIDLVTGSVMTTAPELVRSSTPLDLPGLPAPTVRAYPVVDHIADKVAATEARYSNHTPGVGPGSGSGGGSDGAVGGSSGGTSPRAESTRVRDLIDLIVLARTQHVDGAALHTAIAAERTHRGLPHRDTFAAPAGWATTYPKLAAATVHCHDLPQLAQAVAYVAAFLEPAMAGHVEHHDWSPTDQTWRPR
ncbi:nucleotidyl transferase AbiEii/AbiGii toxin family protein [Kineococcus sp. SYSU DK003]|uniref:nucleotidyl transferase AbiEii/AbiGii toxin family protein n=1 Tax=Kineococcus sp. SYSU DK003 TaxID=3383124 RepID=UPI003D7ED4A2